MPLVMFVQSAAEIAWPGAYGLSPAGTGCNWFRLFSSVRCVPLLPTYATLARKCPGSSFCTYGQITVFGIEVTFSGNSSPLPPMQEYPLEPAGHEPTPPATLNCVDVSTKGAEPSRDSEFPSLPLVCSKKIPYPPRMANLPLPRGSQANPMRGAGLKRCPLRQPGKEDAPTVAPGKLVSTEAGIAPVPPFPPHWMRPLNGLPAPGT